MKIVFRPQKRSWLALGAFILMGFAALAGLWFLASAGQLDAVRGWVPVPRDWLQGARNILNFPAALLAIFSAIYSAFLFSQAEGRDLWQSPLLPFNLFLHATAAGASILLLLSVLVNMLIPALMPVLAAALGFLLATQLLGDFAVLHSTTNAHQGHYLMTHGHYGNLFWSGIAAQAVGLGLAVIGFMLVSPLLGAVGGIFALAGLLAVEHAWVQAGQMVPNS